MSSVNTAAKKTNSNTLVHMLQDAEFKPYLCLVFCPRFKYFNVLFEDNFSSILIKSISKPEMRAGNSLLKHAFGKQLRYN